MKTVVVVTGGREYNDICTAFQVLDDLDGTGNIVMVIHGACKRKSRFVTDTDLAGADRLADDWATMREKMCLRVPAQWKVHGNAAGPHRNGEMLKRACWLAAQASARLVVVAFPGGKGTADCVAKARHKKIEVLEVSR